MEFGEVYDGDGCLGLEVDSSVSGEGWSGFDDIGVSASGERWTRNL